MAARIGKMQSRLDKQLAAKEFYEAGQTYRTLFHRMRTAGKNEEAISLVFNGAIILAQNKEFGAAQDIGCLMMDGFKRDAVEKSLDSIGKVVAVYEAFGDDERKKKFMGQAFEWARTAEGDVSIEPMHESCAMQLYKEAKFREADSHFAHCSSELSDTRARLLSDWAATDKTLGFFYVSEAVLRAIDKDTLEAGESLWKKTIEALCESEEIKSGEAPFEFPILNFTAFIVEALRRNAAPLYKLLVEKYSGVIALHPPLTQVLDKIGKNKFDIQPTQPQGLGGLLGSLMSMVEGAMQNSQQPPANTANVATPSQPAAPQFDDDLDLD